jgi:hypothetical protein
VFDTIALPGEQQERNGMSVRSYLQPKYCQKYKTHHDHSPAAAANLENSHNQKKYDCFLASFFKYFYSI